MALLIYDSATKQILKKLKAGLKRGPEVPRLENRLGLCYKAESWQALAMQCSGVYKEGLTSLPHFIFE